MNNIHQNNIERTIRHAFWIGFGMGAIVGSLLTIIVG